jgi:hypothetical protein
VDEVKKINFKISSLYVSKFTSNEKGRTHLLMFVELQVLLPTSLLMESCNKVTDIGKEQE